MLKGKTALVSGGSRGIGRAICTELGKNGAAVAVVYAGNDKSAAETVELIKAFGGNAKQFKCDVSNFEDSKALVADVLQHFGGLDIIVNNAGITADKLIMQMSEEDFDKVIAVNLKGAFNLIKHAHLHFLKKRMGRIINISSVSGLSGNAGQANYSSSKAGLIGLTKSVAKELASRNITCNAVAPGFVETDMTQAMPLEILEKAVQHIPLKRMGRPEDIAHLVAFLASDSAAYITGEVIKVDGGLYI